MKKAYWVGVVNVKNHEEYKKYADIAGPALVAAGAKILSRGGRIKNLEGEELIVTLLEGPESGTLILNEDGTFSFTPAADFSGEVQFTYEVTDGENIAGATSTIKVRDENFD